MADQNANGNTNNNIFTIFGMILLFILVVWVIWNYRTERDRPLTTSTNIETPRTPVVPLPTPSPNPAPQTEE